MEKIELTSQELVGVTAQQREPLSTMLRRGLGWELLPWQQEIEDLELQRDQGM